MSKTQIIDDGLPMVGEDSGNRGLWIGLGVIGAAGLLLFAALEANRNSNTEAVIASPIDYATATTPRPELILPLETEILPPGYLLGRRNSLSGTATSDGQSVQPPVRLALARPVETSFSSSPQSAPQSYFAPPPLPPAAPEAGRSAPVIVYDALQAVADAVTGSSASSVTSGQSTKAIAVGGGDRTHLVSQGTLIFAVLETAIDSTQSGQVRAMVSTNVFNALGDKVLIQKGSRIFGEYKSDLGAGQNRAQIIWTRLIRPDGATIALDSPASDQLGRSGVKGRVNTHFGQRLVNALLQSTVNFGTLAASRAVSSNNGVILALPNSTQNAGSDILPEVPKPTLTVKHGTRISVFVARDLDFSAVD